MGGAWASSVVCSCSQTGSTRPRTFSIATMVEKADFGSALYEPTVKVISDSGIELEVYSEGGKTGYVYVVVELIGLRTTGYFKVGMTGNPKKTLSDLQTGNVRSLLFTRRVKVKDMQGAETAAHNALKTYSKNLGGGTEWFFVANVGQEIAFHQAFDKAVKPYE